MAMAGSKNVLYSNWPISNLKPLLALCPSRGFLVYRWGEQLRSKNIKGLWSKLQSTLKDTKGGITKTIQKKHTVISNYLLHFQPLQIPLYHLFRSRFHANSMKLQSNTDSFMEVASLQISWMFVDVFLLNRLFSCEKCAKKCWFLRHFWGTLPWNFFELCHRFSATRITKLHRGETWHVQHLLREWPQVFWGHSGVTSYNLPTDASHYI